MRAHLRGLLLDGFDPDTGDLAVRVAFLDEDAAAGPQFLRLKLHLGRTGDPLQPLKRELQTHVQMPVPPLWERGLKVVIRAIEDELVEPQGREPGRYTWVRTQVVHATDERRSTLNHPLARQVEILWDWAQRADHDGDVLRVMEYLERLLFLAPRHLPALEWLSRLLRQQGMVEESLEITERLVAAQPDSPEALLRKGELLLFLERAREAQAVFAQLLKLNPMHPLAHLGAAQARSLQGGDPFPHLDAALELGREPALSVLRETFDYRILASLGEVRKYRLDELPALLSVSPGEVRAFVERHGLPLHPPGVVREPELSHWVGIQNRYCLLSMGLHWAAPTPLQLPDPV